MTTENDRAPHTHGGTDAPECTPYGIPCRPAEKDAGTCPNCGCSTVLHFSDGCHRAYGFICRCPNDARKAEVSQLKGGAA